MKKLTMLLLVLVICSAAVFADDYGFSVGGGFSFVFNYTTAAIDWTPTPAGVLYGLSDDSTKQTIKEFNYGGFLFFDAKYVEFVVTLAGGPSDINVEFPSPIGGDDTFSKNTSNLSFGVFGKYPFKLGPVILFPLAGIDYVVYLTGTYPADDGTSPAVEGVHRNVAGDFNTFWFKFGGGVDIPLQEKLFIRIEALYGFALENRFQKNGEDSAAEDNPVMKGEVDWGWINGPTIRIGLGYRF